MIRLLDDKPTAREFYDQMPGLYPDRLNPGVVWLGARGCSAGNPRGPVAVLLAGAVPACR